MCILVRTCEFLLLQALLLGSLAVRQLGVDDEDGAIAHLRAGCCALAQGCGSGAQEEWKASEDLEVSVEQLRSYFEASSQDSETFLSAIGLSHEDGTLSCSSLLLHSIRYVSDVMGMSIPPHRGVYCEHWIRMPTETQEGICGEWLDLSTEAVEAIASQLDPSKFEEPLTPDFDVVTESVVDDDPNSASISENDPWQYSVSELALTVLQVFNIFPSQPSADDPLSKVSSLLERENPTIEGIDPLRHSELHLLVAKAHAWVLAALNKVPTTPDVVKKWFGSDSKDSMHHIRKIVLGMTRTLNKAHLKLGDHTCRGATLAYVKISEIFSMHGGPPKKKTEKSGNRDVINLCLAFFDPRFYNTMDQSYGTMVHEASHHQFTVDVPYKGRSPYGQENCLAMTENPGAAMQNADNYK